MLLGQQGCRHQHRDLLAVGDRDERGAQCDFRLAEAHVAADETVHRFAGDEILDDRFDGGGLIRRLFESEAFGERFVVVHVELERVAFARRALCVQVEQFRSRVMRALRSFLSRLVPLTTAKFVQWRGLGRGAAVAADQMQAGDGDVQFCVVGVQQMQEFVRTVTEIERRQAEIAPDTVLLVDHRIADAHLRQVTQHRVDIASPCLSLTSATNGGRIKLGFGDDREVGRRPDKPGVQGRDGKSRAYIARHKFRPSRRRPPA